MPTEAPDPQPDWLIGANALKTRHGGISDSTLVRRLKDPSLHFPQPILIGRLRYWRVSELLDWERAQLRRPGSLTEPQTAPSEPPDAGPAAGTGEAQAAPAAAQPASRPASSLERLVRKSRAARSRAPTADC